jgi:thiol-disulfide isomerase/thioredoxin
MAPQKRFQSASYTKTRKGKQNRKRPYYPKTVRGHRHSTAGKIFPLLHVDRPSKLHQIRKYFKQGPVVLVIFVADWCGHCKNLEPHIEAAANLRQRNIPMMTVSDKMVSGYNNMVRSFNSAAPPIEPDGFPSPILVSSNGEKLSEIAATEAALRSAAVNVGPVAVEAGLSPGSSRLSNGTRMPVTPRNGSPERVAEEIATNELPVSGYVTPPTKMNSFEHTTTNYSNDNIIRQGEPSRNGKQEEGKDVGVSPPIQSLTFSAKANTRRPSSPIITQTVPNNAVKKMPKGAEGEITKKEADEITSFQAAPDAKPVIKPISPGVISDIRVPGVGGSIIGGGNRGGSLYDIMSQSAYRLAPAAVLLATAAAVMKKKTRNNKKKGTKKRR